jgi:hypothetical protein
MNESLPLPVFVKDFQGGFKDAVVCVDDLKTAKRRKALNKILF